MLEQFNQQLKSIVLDTSIDREKEFIESAPDIIKVISLLRDGTDIIELKVKLNAAKVKAASLIDVEEFKDKIIETKNKIRLLNKEYNNFKKEDYAHSLVTETHKLFEHLYNTEYYAMQKLKALEKSIVIKLNMQLLDLYFELLEVKLFDEFDILSLEIPESKFEGMQDYFTIEENLDDKINFLREYIIRFKKVRNELYRNSSLNGAQRLLEFTDYFIYYLEKIIEFKKEQDYQHKVYSSTLSNTLLFHNVDVANVLMKGYITSNIVEYVSFSTEAKSSVNVVFPFSKVAKNNLVSQQDNEIRVWPRRFLGTDMFPLNEGILLVKTNEPEQWIKYIKSFKQLNSWFRRYNIDVDRWISEHVSFTDVHFLNRKCEKGLIIPVDEHENNKLFRFEC